MGRLGDGEMGRWGDGEMGRWGDAEIGCHRHTASPCLRFLMGSREVGSDIMSDSIGACIKLR
ncbi:MAG: hypothetical protein F6K54_33235 [Okeania sp. SIO3B5]|uniref:hypothetical protein n=1 Tax=Okeania sp. SIO3B5 TaxID=2607811 RepID=UPI0013FF6736|nr:hypothetical protein [Okeania sp. SIO3B5]NEO57509.1 hypothetical protein [Okeania sp. SIO3B5]